MTLPADVDTTRWYPDRDRTGAPVGPGDQVLVFTPLVASTYAVGCCELSEDFWCPIAKTDERIGRLIVNIDGGLVVRPDVHDIYGPDGPETDKAIRFLRAVVQEEIHQAQKKRDNIQAEIDGLVRMLTGDALLLQRKPR